MRQVSWAERQIRRVDRFQQRHAVLGFPWAVVQKFGDDQAGSKAALMAYYGLFALFPLLLLLATILGFALSGDPALRESLIDSALGNLPVIGDQIRSDVHPLEGNTTALIIGLAGTIYGSLGIGFASQNAMNKVWNIPYVRWPGFWGRYARKVLTAEPLRAREVAVGAILATVFWEALQLAGTWYVTRGLRHAGPTYGFFAVVITLLSWLYLGSQLTLWAAEINVVLRYRLWPRSLMRPPLTAADKLMLVRLAEMEVRRPEQQIITSFTDEADEDPLRSAPEPRQAPP